MVIAWSAIITFYLYSFEKRINDAWNYFSNNQKVSLQANTARLINSLEKNKATGLSQYWFAANVDYLINTGESKFRG